MCEYLTRQKRICWLLGLKLLIEGREEEQVKIRGSAEETEAAPSSAAERGLNIPMVDVRNRSSMINYYYKKRVCQLTNKVFIY